MADPEHGNLLRQGPERVRQWLEQNQSGRLDLSGAQLPSANYQSWDLSRSDFSGANLNGAVLQSAKLRGAILRGADLTGANLHAVDLSDAHLEGTKFNNARMDEVILTNAHLGDTSFERANLSGVDLRGVDLRSCNLVGVNFTNAKLDGAQLAGAQLNEANLSHAHLADTDLSTANLDRAVLVGADLTGASLVGASLQRARMDGAKLVRAKVGGANFFEAVVDNANFNSAQNVPNARSLHTVRLNTNGGDVEYFERVTRRAIDRFISWERLRFLGRLPLFGASYSALLAVPFFYYLLDFYNRHVDVLRAWAARDVQGDGARTAIGQVVLAHLHHEPIPGYSLLTWISTICLGLGATIFLACPSRVREFSRDQWRDQLRHSLIHYWPFAWRYRPLRVACVFFYVVGGVGAAWVITTKLWSVLWFILENR